MAMESGTAELNELQPTLERQSFELLRAASANLRAMEVQIAGLVTAEELTITSQRLTIGQSDLGVAVKMALTGSLVISESSLNAFLKQQRMDHIADLQVAMLSGKLRIKGRYRLLPFTVIATAQCEGGARIRLIVTELRLLGAGLPDFSAHVIEEKMNTGLAHALDITRTGLPIRLTGITVEPGRLALAGAAEIDIRPGAARPDTT